MLGSAGAAFVLAAGLSACGGDNDGGKGATASAASSGASDGPSEEQIQERSGAAVTFAPPGDKGSSVVYNAPSSRRRPRSRGLRE